MRDQPLIYEVENEPLKTVVERLESSLEDLKSFTESLEERLDSASFDI